MLKIRFLSNTLNLHKIKLFNRNQRWKDTSQNFNLTNLEEYRNLNLFIIDYYFICESKDPFDHSSELNKY